MVEIKSDPKVLYVAYEELNGGGRMAVFAAQDLQSCFDGMMKRLLFVWDFDGVEGLSAPVHNIEVSGYLQGDAELELVWNNKKIGIMKIGGI